MRLNKDIAKMVNDPVIKENMQQVRALSSWPTRRQSSPPTSRRRWRALRKL